MERSRNEFASDTNHNWSGAKLSSESGNTGKFLFATRILVFTSEMEMSALQ